MVNNYKILRKAQLTDELFVGSDDAAAWQQDQADREWARTLDPEPGEARVAPAWPGAPRKREEIRDEVRDEIREDVREEILMPEEVEEPQDLPALAEPATERTWAQMLAELTGSPALEGIRTLGVCALEGKQGGSPATAALALWMAQNSETPTLVVEAHFGEPRLARAFGARDQGIAELARESETVDKLIQETPESNLKLLAGGGPMSGRERRKALRELPGLLASLRDRFPAILVELPAVDDPDLDRLPVATLTDAVILVADSKSARPRKLQRAADKLRDARANLAASMLSSTQKPAAQALRGLFGQQVERAEHARGGSRRMG